MECRFCNLEEKEKSRVLAVREHCVVIFSDPRLMEGHLLVIPKRHVIHLSELDDRERKELFDVTIEFQEKIIASIAPGCDIRQNDRPFLAESAVSVDHVHMHLQPRALEDELYTKSQIYENDIFAPLSGEEVEKVRDLLNG